MASETIPGQLDAEAPKHLVDRIVLVDPIFLQETREPDRWNARSSELRDETASGWSRSPRAPGGAPLLLREFDGAPRHRFEPYGLLSDGGASRGTQRTEPPVNLGAVQTLPEVAS